MMETAKTRTFQADVELDEDGKPLPPDGKPPRAGKLDGDENIVIVEAAAPGNSAVPAPAQSPSTQTDQPGLFESSAAPNRTNHHGKEIQRSRRWPHQHRRQSRHPRQGHRQENRDPRQRVIEVAGARKDPALDIPIRGAVQRQLRRSPRILKMGDSTQTRNFFNLGQAKKFMQTMLSPPAQGPDRRGKNRQHSRSLLQGQHTIAGTNEKTFAEQDESDPIIEDLEVALNSLREELHVFAKEKGKMVGNITIEDNGDTIDLRRMGTGGYAIPSIVEPDVIQFKKFEAKFVLHVEKGTVWTRFNEDRFWEKHNCILTEGGGQPPRGVRRLLHRLHNELKLPVYLPAR